MYNYQMMERHLDPEELIKQTLLGARDNPRERRLLQTVSAGENEASFDEVITRFQRASRVINDGNEVRISPQGVSA